MNPPSRQPTPAADPIHPNSTAPTRSTSLRHVSYEDNTNGVDDPLREVKESHDQEKAGEQAVSRHQPEPFQPGPPDVHRGWRRRWLWGAGVLSGPVRRQGHQRDEAGQLVRPALQQHQARKPASPNSIPPKQRVDQCCASSSLGNQGIGGQQSSALTGAG